MDAGLDHLFGILGFRAFANGLALLQGNLLLQWVAVVESDSLVEGHWLLVLVLEVSFHALVLVTVITHLVPALVLFGSGGLVINSVANASESCLELLP